MSNPHKLSDKRERSVQKFAKYLACVSQNDLEFFYHKLLKKEEIPLEKIEGKKAIIKPMTPNWISFMIAFDDQNNTKFYQTDVDKNLINEKGNYKKNVQETKPRVGSIKIGDDVIKFTGDLDLLTNLINNLLINGTIEKKDPIQRKKKPHVEKMEEVNSI